MNLSKNNLIIGAVALVAVVIGLGYWFWPSTKITQAKMIDWVAYSYAQQFCTVVFPHISDCINLHGSDCKAVAKAQILDCIKDTKGDLPAFITTDNAKKLFNSYGKCFEQKMHGEMMENYLIPTPECKQRFH